MIGIETLLSRLAALDVQLSLDGDRLRCNAPEGVLTAPLRAALSERKADIIRHLRSVPASGFRADGVLPKISRDDTIPLSFAQQRLWFLDQLEGPNAAYNVPMALTISGELQPAALREALDAVVARHETLRTTFVTRRGQAAQVIATSLKIPLTILDLRDLPTADRKTEFHRLATLEAQKPFDLDAGPLLRATLVRLGDREHGLVINLHHIVSDGWSAGVLLRELTLLYDASATGAAPNLPELPIQYADYAAWQRNWLQGEVLDRELSYWKRQLAGLPPVLSLPADRPRPPVMSYRGSVESFEIDRGLARALAALGRRHEATLFMTLLSAYAVLLSRYSGQQDVAIGSPIANRHRRATESLIGFFVNALVLRADLSGNSTFEDLLRRMRAVCLEAYDHQDLPFEHLVEALQPERDLSHSPLFQAMLMLQNAPAEALELPGLVVESVPLQSPTAHFDLVLSITETASGLTAALEYRTDIFERDTIVRMIRHFRTLLEGIVANPGAKVAELPLLTPAERRLQLDEWNQTDAAYSREKCLHELFEARAARNPAAPAVIFDGGQWSYAELNARSNRLAAHLQALGVGPESLVGIYLEHSPEMIAGLMGILKAGGAYIPLDHRWPAKRVQQILSSLGAAVLVTRSSQWPAVVSLQTELPQLRHIICLDSLRDAEPRHRTIAIELRQRAINSKGLSPSPLRSGGEGRGEEAPSGPLETNPSPPALSPLRCAGRGRKPPSLSANWLSSTAVHHHPGPEPSGGQTAILWTVEQLERMPSGNVASSVGPENTAYIIFTSGSTGAPKGVMVRHRPVINVIEWVNQTFAVGPQDRLLFVTSVCFDLSVYDVFGMLAGGGSIRVVSETDLQSPERLLDCLQHEPITFWDSAPAALQQAVPLLSREIGRKNALRLVFFSGDWIPVKLPDAVRAAFPGARVISLGGATEAAIWSNFFPIEKVDPDWPSIPYGKPIQNARYYILDRRLNPCPIGVPGELHIGGECLASGYVNDPAQTAERFIPDPFGGCPGSLLYKTGDLTRFHTDGNIEILGRLDQQVKIRGFRIEIGEIETVLAAHPLVGEAVIAVRHDQPGGPALVAYVTLKNGLAGKAPAREEVVSSFRNFLRETLPDYMVPSAFVLMEKLPLSANGKLDRQALPAPEIAASESPFAPPRNEREKLLCSIWSEVLGRERVGIHDNFFLLGGDSISSIQVIARARQGGLQLSPRHVFQHQTIAELAAVAAVSAGPLAEQGRVTGPVPLTPAQHWFFEQELDDPHHFNQSVLLSVPARFSPRLFEQALKAIGGHHDALRLRFQRAGALWEQHNAEEETNPVFITEDLSSGAGEREWRFKSAAQRLQQSLRLAEGPLFRAGYFPGEPGAAGRLLLVVHHLAIDAVSWGILLDDLQTVYRQLGSGEPVSLPPKSTSFKQFAERLRDHAGNVTDETDYWLRTMATTPELPCDFPNGVSQNTAGSRAHVAVSLDEKETRALLEDVGEAYHARVHEILLAALAQAFQSWTGAPAFRLDIENHGREDLFESVDLSRTVGWFTTIYPVRLETGRENDPGWNLKSIKEQLRRVPHRGIGHGLLRYLEPGSAEKLKGVPSRVSFNYLGQSNRAAPREGLFGLAEEERGGEQSARGKRLYWIEVSGAISEGVLEMNFSYSPNLHARATMEKLSGGFQAALRQLIAGCQGAEAGGYTPSDFEDVNLDQAKLDQILAEVDTDVAETP